MKNLLCYLFLSIVSLKTFGQNAEPSTGDEQMEEATYYYGNKTGDRNKDFQIKHKPLVFRRAYRVNSANGEADVYERALGYARMININYKAEKEKGKIIVPIEWKYKGGFNECIENLDIKADLVLEVKDIKTRISLAHITYKHHDKADGNGKPIAKTDFFSRHPDCAPEKGKAELLYNCDECNRSVRSIDKNFQEQFENFAAQYQEWLRKY